MKYLIIAAALLFSTQAHAYSIKTSCKGPAPDRIDGGYNYSVTPGIAGPCKTDKDNRMGGVSVRQEHNTTMLHNVEYEFTATYEFDNELPPAYRMTIFQLHAGKSNAIPPFQLIVNHNGCLVENHSSGANKEVCNRVLRFDIKVQWKRGKYLKVYKDGEMIIDKKWLSPFPHYAKWGLYGVKLQRPVSLNITDIKLRKLN